MTINNEDENISSTEQSSNQPIFDNKEIISQYVDHLNYLKSKQNQIDKEINQYAELLNKVKYKDYEPIKFEFLQSDIEKYMYVFNECIDCALLSFNLTNKLTKIKNEFQHKINQHIEYGDWIIKK